MTVPEQSEQTNPNSLYSVLKKGIRDAIAESPVSRVLRLAVPSATPTLEKVLAEDRAREAVEKSEGISGNTEGQDSGEGGKAAGLTEAVEDIADEEAAKEQQ